MAESVAHAELLPQARWHSRPYRFLTCERALPEPTLSLLLRLFERDQDWQEHDSFYKASIARVSAQLPHALLVGMSSRMRALTGLELSDRVEVTIQTMVPGQFAGPHSDRPLLGYEAARLIVQLNPDWSPGDGGELLLHPDTEGAQVGFRRPPRHNTAFGFVMHRGSVHSVTPTRCTRRTAVFNFWHRGNSEELARALSQAFAGMRFDQLPSCLDDAVARAEAQLPESISFQACATAWLLQRWASSQAVLQQGFERALLPLRIERVDSEPGDRVQLARWLVQLQHEDFDPRLWEALGQRFAEQGGDASLDEQGLAFPTR